MQAVHARRTAKYIAYMRCMNRMYFMPACHVLKSWLKNADYGTAMVLDILHALRRYMWRQHAVRITTAS